MKPILAQLIFFFFAINLQAQLPYQYTKSDSVCIQNEFDYFIELDSNRYLVSKYTDRYLTDKNGNITLDLAEYSNLIFTYFNSNLTPARALKSARYGFINQTGQLIIPHEYEYATGFCNGNAVVRKNEKYGIIDTANQITVPLTYEHIRRPYNDLFVAKKDSLSGIIDIDQNIVLDFLYHDLSFHKNGLLKARFKNGYRIINLSKQKAKEEAYEDLRSFSTELSRFKLNGKWGLLNQEGEVVVENKYQLINRIFHGSSVIVTPKNKYGLIDGNGTIITPIEYDHIVQNGHTINAKKDDQYFQISDEHPNYKKKITGPSSSVGPCNMFLKTKKDTLLSFQDLNTNEIFEGVYFSSIKEISAGHLLGKIGDYWYYYPLDNSTPLGPFLSATPFIESEAIVQSKKSKKYYVINPAGKILSAKYDELTREDKFYLARDGDKWGLTNSISKKKISFTYDELRKIPSSKTFLVKLNNKYGLVDGTKNILPIEFDTLIGSFSYGGILEGHKNNEIFAIDRTGKTLNEPKIKYIDNSTYSKSIVSTTTGFGVINNKLEYLVEPIYEDIGNKLGADKCRVKSDGLWGFMDYEGNQLIPAVFTRISIKGNNYVVYDQDKFIYINDKFECIRNCDERSVIEKLGINK